MADKVRGRFAPSPSGRMHLGNLFCSLLAWLSAKSRGGSIVLRHEDLDPARTSREFADQIERDYEFLGLLWDEGGSGGGPFAPYYQSGRSALYEHCLHRLEETGLVYPCFCSRAELHAADAPHAADGEPVYSGRCRRLTAAQVRALERKRAPALRLQVPEETIEVIDGKYGLYAQDLAADCGDFLLRRSDGVFAYQLAVVADDAAMGITEVVRGRDLLASAPRQVWLDRMLGCPLPSFCHTPLLLAPDGRRLSKRDGDLSLDALRARGYTAPQIIGRLAFLAGLVRKPEPLLPADLVRDFDMDKVPAADILLPADLFG